MWALCSREILVAIGHFSLCQQRAKYSKFFASFSCWPGHPATARCVRGSCRNFWHCAARDRNYQDGRGSVRHSFSICHRRNSILAQLMANELSHHIEGFYLSWNSYFCVRNLAGYYKKHSLPNGQFLWVAGFLAFLFFLMQYLLNGIDFILSCSRSRSALALVSVTSRSPRCCWHSFLLEEFIFTSRKKSISLMNGCVFLYVGAHYYQSWFTYCYQLKK